MRSLRFGQAIARFRPANHWERYQSAVFVIRPDGNHALMYGWRSIVAVRKKSESMKPEDLDPTTTYIWTRGGRSVEVRFLEHLPAQTPMESETSLPSMIDMLPRCKVQDIQTGQVHQVWLAELDEAPH